MISFSESTIQSIAVHKTGNKLNEEGIVFSKAPLDPGENIMNLLSAYFLSPFKSVEYFTFFHESDLELNEVYVYASRIFDDPQSLFDQSVNLAKHLYEQSIHPKIKAGELYTVYFNNCIVDGEMTDAVGLFKSESRETFLKVYSSGTGFEIESENGININKLDKGCLIFNTERENGYVVSVIDNTNRGAEAHYWFDDFLQVRQRKDAYFNTQQALSMCKNFVTQELPQQFEMSKADQADFLNKSVKFFKEKEKFDTGEFAREVMGQDDVIESFNRYKNDYQQENQLEFADSFSISESAVKKQARNFKSVIKLDKNFHIYVHGNRSLIEQGTDDNGRKFYKLYYEEES